MSSFSSSGDSNGLDGSSNDVVEVESGDRCRGCARAEKAKAASRSQLGALSQENDQLSLRILELEDQLTDMETLNQEFRALLVDTGVSEEVIESISGASALSTSASSMSRSDRVLERRETRALKSASSFANVVTTDGDGVVPTACIASVSPHGLSNVISMAPISSSPRLVLTGGADKSLILTCFVPRVGEKEEDGEREVDRTLLHSYQAGIALVPAPALCISVLGATTSTANGSIGSSDRSGGENAAVVAVGHMDGTVSVWRLTWVPSASSPPASKEVVGEDCSPSTPISSAALPTSSVVGLEKNDSSSSASSLILKASFELLWQDRAHTKYLTRCLWLSVPDPERDNHDNNSSSSSSSSSSSNQMHHIWLLATCSQDKSLCLYALDEGKLQAAASKIDEGKGGGGSSGASAADGAKTAATSAATRSRLAPDLLQKMQQVYFSGGVNAMATLALPSLGCSCLTVAVQGAPVLYYLLIKNLPKKQQLQPLSSMSVSSESESSSGPASPPNSSDDAAVLSIHMLPPSLPQKLPIFESASASSFPSSSLGSDGKKLSTLLELLLYQVPLSEDGGITEFSLDAAAQKEHESNSGNSSSDGGGTSGVKVSSASTESSPAGQSASATAEVQSSILPKSPVFTEGDSSEKHLFSPATSTVQAAGGSSDYLPVGFSIMDLAVSIVQAKGTSSSPASLSRKTGVDGGPLLVAASADNGIVYIFKWGTNVMVNKLVGHQVTAISSSSSASASASVNHNSRCCWMPARSSLDSLALLGKGVREGGPSALSSMPSPLSPSNYLCVTSTSDFSSIIYSASGSGRIIARVGGPSPSSSASSSQSANSSAVTGDEKETNARMHYRHTAIIKDLGWMDGSTFVTCSFDKKLMLWST